MSDHSSSKFTKDRSCKKFFMLMSIYWCLWEDYILDTTKCNLNISLWLLSLFFIIDLCTLFAIWMVPPAYLMLLIVVLLIFVLSCASCNVSLNIHSVYKLNKFTFRASHEINIFCDAFCSISYIAVWLQLSSKVSLILWWPYSAPNYIYKFSL